jgi:ornithine cyclodeaminase
MDRMVSYIGFAEIQTLLRRIGTARFIAELAKEIEADYRRWSDFQHSPRLASHSATGVIELMPATDGKLFSFKYVNGHPANTASGLLTVTAFGVLAEVCTGYPLLVAEMTVATALRTAAMSALAATYMARSDSRSMAMIGCGAQAEFQAIAFHTLCGIRELRVRDIDPGSMAKVERNLRSVPDLVDLRIVRAETTAAACDGADVITTATADKRNAFILTPSMVRQGMHLNAIGGDCPGKTELDPNILLLPTARIVVEYERQARIEGEIQRLPAGHPVHEFTDVVSGAVTGREHPDEITIFDSVGFALEDHSALRYLLRLLREEGAGTRTIDLVPALRDPRDLFGEVLGEAEVGRQAAVQPPLCATTSS